MTSPTYPHLSRALDAIYHLLWRANGRTVSVDELYAAYKPSTKHANKGANVRASIRHLRAALSACGWKRAVVTSRDMGYRLNVARAPEYRPPAYSETRLEGARRPITIIPLPDRGADLEPTCWLSNRFLEVV